MRLRITCYHSRLVDLYINKRELPLCQTLDVEIPAASKSQNQPDYYLKA